MMKYLVILLDDTSVAFCHADNPLEKRNLMPLDILRKAILFGMKENLMIQYAYPPYELPDEYKGTIESIDHVKIGRDLCIYQSIPNVVQTRDIVLRVGFKDFIKGCYQLSSILPQINRLNICFTDIEDFSDDEIDSYQNALKSLIDYIVEQYRQGKQPQVNLLTDRLRKEKMYNCGAGDTNITVAPNGNFYLCPAFYYDEKMMVDNMMNHTESNSERSVGSVDSGLRIENQQLLKLHHAPICRVCDAYHCNRCIWLNQKLTLDINTPSHQQCIVSHIERNASRLLQAKLVSIGVSIGQPIKEIDYLDPFESIFKY